MRVPFIAGNWKMNNTIEQGVELVKKLMPIADATDVQVAVCVPFLGLKEIVELTKDSKLLVGAQNMHWEENGAFTGEVSPTMLNEIGVELVVLGHSERREYFGETNETVNKKVKSALAHGIRPILCCGESLETREANEEKNWVKTQILEGVEGISEDDMTKIVIAYEPIWAIGTGKTATSEQANEMCAFIRETLNEKYGSEVSEEVIIQYGGSVKPANVTEIMNQEDIDGALVGGASLKADSFTDIINF
ncbi:MAG: triose-phosphate isomerase [Tissierellales bacterium]|jgi:triosephosphate isomerase|nr:triose-phosphate isomerase [Tissierellales bacterium]